MIKDILLHILNAVIANPDLLDTDSEISGYTPNIKVKCQQNEINRSMDNPEIDEGTDFRQRTIEHNNNKDRSPAAEKYGKPWGIGYTGLRRRTSGVFSSSSKANFFCIFLISAMVMVSVSEPELLYIFWSIYAAWNCSFHILCISAYCFFRIHTSLLCFAWIPLYTWCFPCVSFLFYYYTIFRIWLSSFLV